MTADTGGSEAFWRCSCGLRLLSDKAVALHIETGPGHHFTPDTGGSMSSDLQTVLRTIRTQVVAEFEHSTYPERRDAILAIIDRAALAAPPARLPGSMSSEPQTESRPNPRP